MAETQTPNRFPLSDAQIVGAVNDAYSAKAQASVQEAYAKNVAEAFGYTQEQLQSVPAESHLGLSCGNPVKTANIKPGEVVLDLGSGGGMDVFLAAAITGSSGQAIGLDGSTDMIALARRNARSKNLKPPQVAFVQTSLTDDLPIATGSVDCTLSNCVINLLPLAGKAKLLKETFRVLKPGGRIVLDDIIAKAALPDEIRNEISAYINCISGSIQLSEYQRLLDDAGFSGVFSYTVTPPLHHSCLLPTDTFFADTHKDLNVYRQAEGDPVAAASSGCCSAAEKPGFDDNEWVASYQIFAVKGHPTTAETPPTSVLLRWWDAYPTVKTPAALMSPEEVAALVRDPSRTDYAVIDVRREDRVGGHVRGSHQWHAQTFYDNLPAFFEKFGRTERVIFYCGSSHGRGPRCAGWYQHYLNSEAGRGASSTSYVLTGGVKAWIAKFGDEHGMVETLFPFFFRASVNIAAVFYALQCPGYQSVINWACRREYGPLQH